MDAPDLLSPLAMATVSQATEYLWNGPDVAYVFNASFNTSFYFAGNCKLLKGPIHPGGTCRAFAPKA